MIYKNWSSDAREGCSFAIFVFKDFYFVEAKNLDEHEDLGGGKLFSREVNRNKLQFCSLDFRHNVTFTFCFSW